jgi:hypothetical protein
MNKKSLNMAVGGDGKQKPPAEQKTKYPTTPAKKK